LPKIRLVFDFLGQVGILTQLDIWNRFKRLCEDW